MKKSRILLTFIEFVLAVKIEFYRNILKGLKTTGLFTNVKVVMDVAEAAVDALEKAYLDALGGDHLKILLRKKLELSTDDLFRDIAHDINKFANGDQTIISSVGFEYTTDKSSPTSKPPFVVKAGKNLGEIDLKVQRIKGVLVYLYQIAKGKLPENEKEWDNICYNSKTKRTVKDLELGTEYYFRVAGITKDGILDFTAPILKFVEKTK